LLKDKFATGANRFCITTEFTAEFDQMCVNCSLSPSHHSLRSALDISCPSKLLLLLMHLIV